MDESMAERTERTIRALLEMHAEVEAERDAARADLVALLEGMEQVGWTFIPLQDWPSDDIPGNRVAGVIYQAPLPSATDVRAEPIYRLSPSAASLHAGLTGAVTGPSAPAAPIEESK